MKHCLEIKILLSLSALLLASCAPEISSNNRISEGASVIGITQASPQHGSQDVSLDSPIEITFDKKLDMPSVHATQVEIWTDTGNQISWKDLQVSGKFIGNGSMMKIRLKSDWLPLTKYIVALRGTLPKDSKSNSVLAGIRGIDGSYLQPTSFSFTTGRGYKNDVFSGPPQVKGISPGQMITGGMDNNVSVGQAFTGATTIVPNNDIKIAFSKPIKHYAVDKFGTPLSTEIPLTPIDKFSGLAVGVLDSRVSLSEFTRAVPNSSTQSTDWEAFLSSVYQQRLKGKIHTENGRRLLVFQLDVNCPNRIECTYPDNNSISNIASVVAVIISGFISVDKSLPLAGSPNIGGFVHIGGYKAGDGYPTVNSGLAALQGVFTP